MHGYLIELERPKCGERGSALRQARLSFLALLYVPSCDIGAVLFEQYLDSCVESPAPFKIWTMIRRGAIEELGVAFFVVEPHDAGVAI